MVKRPTIPDLARAAGVSVSTVNRVIGGADNVRQPTRERVLHAAQQIGFYGIGTLKHSIQQGLGTHRLGILLQQGDRAFYRALGTALERASRSRAEGNVDLQLEFLGDLSPDHVAKRLLAMGERCETVGLVAAEHPLVSDAIDTVLERGVPVCGLIAPLTAHGQVGFVGLDNWKVGRTAAWAFDKLCRIPGKIGILVGNHRYRNQELNESGFRSYFREHNRAFVLLEPHSTYESAAVARELTEQLLVENPDMCGLFVSGGGITGSLAALRNCKRREGFVSVGYELFATTRAGLIDGTLSLVLSHPRDAFAHAIIATMIEAKKRGVDGGTQHVTLPFEVYTSENI